jgi:lysophospholipase L1-like esterase/chitodextrinase
MSVPRRGTANTVYGDSSPRALRDYLVLRAVTPCRFVILGSSTPAGSTATTVANRVVNRLLVAIQSAYPAPSGTTEQTIGTLDTTPSTAGGIQFYNGAVSGNTSSNYADSTTITKAVAIAPRVIIHWVGSNDYAANVAPTTYKANLKSVIDSIDAQLTAPHIHVLIQGHERFDVTGRTYTWAQYGRAQDELAASQILGNVFNVDISSYFYPLGVAPSTQYGTDTLGLMNADKIHMLDAGHALMAEAIARQLGIINTPQAALVLADTTPPTVPGTPTATAGTTSATLTWAASTDANAPITYLVYSSADNYTNAIGTIQSTSFTATSLPAGTAVSFKVAARDPSNNTSAQSAASNAVTPTASTGADTTAPGVSTLSAKPKPASALLTWSAATDDVGVTNYRIFRDGTAVTTVGNVLTYTDSALTNGTRYSYTIAAMDSAGNIGTQSAAALVVPGQIVDNFDRTASALSGQTAETGETWLAPISHTLDILPTGLVKRNYATDASATTGRALNIVTAPLSASGGFKYAIKLGAAPTAAGVASGGPAFESTADGSNFYYLGLRASTSSLVYAFFQIPTLGGGASTRGAAGVSTVTPQSGDLIEIVRTTANPLAVSLYVNGVFVLTTGTTFATPSSSNAYIGMYENGDAVFEYDSISFTQIP